MTLIHTKPSEYEDILINVLTSHMCPLYKIGRQDIIQFAPIGLDIETSTLYERDEQGKVSTHFSFMYIWQLSVFNHTFIGRTLEDLEHILSLIKEHLCHNHYKTIIFIHNQSFEMSFFLMYFLQSHKIEVFARSKRHPMKVTYDDSIIFLDSALITGFSLAKLAENYTTTQKLIGDLDYDKVRLPKTPITKKELGYCINDVQILSEYAQYYADKYLSKGFLPMTSTMVASRVVKDKIKELKQHKEVFYLINSCYPDTRQKYEFIMSFYYGAYTHGYLLNLFQTIEDVLKFDVNSEYPYALMLPEYPIEKFKTVQLKKVKDEVLNDLLQNFCCLIDITLTNIKTFTGVTIISKNNAIAYKNAVWDNGRLHSADSIRIRCTQKDLETFRLHYNFDKKIIYHHFLYAKKGYLPKYFRLAIAELYNFKNTLKGVEGKEIEYMESKKKLNGQYGSLVCRLQFFELLVSLEGWYEKEKDIDFQKEKVSKNKLPQWGIFCTSVARSIILSAIAQLKEGKEKLLLNYIYSDTDSIAAKNKPYVLKVFDAINKKTIESNKKWVEDLGLKELYPDTDFTQMGVFDNETYNKKEKRLEPLKRFKTLGAKRYIVEKYDGTIETTVAGMRKKAFIEYCDKRGLDYFEAFHDKFMLSYDESEKLTTYYCDKTVTREVTDYLGNKEEVTAYGYVSLIPTTFKLSIKDDLKKLAIEEGNEATYDL